MKNRYLKGAHLSERKFKEILKLFSEDLTATQIASISGVSRVTVNSYLKKIRQQIARYCELQQPAESIVKPVIHERYEHHEHRNGHDAAVSVKTEVNRAIKPIVFGIYRHADRLHTEILPDVSRAMIHAIVRGRSVLETLGAAERIRHFSNIVDLGHYRLYRLEHAISGETNGSIALADDIDAFWGLTKHRLAKFKGLNRNTVYLHLKECEFRYNHRNEELYEVLLNLLKTHTLNLS
ncbi:IS1595 family transposase [uncultured Chitinophaga sp.]|jgi:Response regulator of citrate/malate metabolism|uniref:IS1595 family transposase n=1 Tax=uncultured Chitinophaga sp. TaxID=339340 RepID=UPI00261FB809|nr:IS1595 family transposase [uncultured Chitinophaga sp.]